MKNDFEKIISGLNNYFNDYSQDDLKKKVFPKSPELFNYIAKQRKFGIPWNYRKIQESLPVDEHLFFFESNLGKQYTGNPRYIYERMLERYPDFKYVWCYSGESEIPGNPIIVERGSETYYKYLAQARYIINNTTFPLWYHRPETFYLQTWHGTPFKRLHWDITTRPVEQRSQPEFYVKSTMWDALLSPNSYSTEKFRSAFRYEGEILESGYPANDIFYHKSKYEKVRKKIRKQLGIKNDRVPVYLYAPTWRDGKHLGNSMFEFDLLLDTQQFLREAPKNSVLLVRSHHMSSSEDKIANLEGRVIDVSGFDDAIELMCASDILITDYSSIVFDWYCSKKPVIYYVPDYEEYTEKTRGSYFDLEEINAGPICKSMDDLITSLFDLSKVKTTAYNEFYDMFCNIHNGDSADTVIDFLLKK